MTYCRAYASPIVALLLTLAAPATPAEAQCRLCAPSESTEPEAIRPLTIQVETGIDFSRVAIGSGAGGTVEVDPVTGQRRVSGGLVDLGGLAVTGTVRVAGEPGRGVRITLPRQAALAAADGGTAELHDIVTDLPPAPRLGPDGTLRFAFGGRLAVNGRATGSLRGRIPIVADYE